MHSSKCPGRFIPASSWENTESDEGGTYRPDDTDSSDESVSGAELNNFERKSLVRTRRLMERDPMLVFLRQTSLPDQS